MYADGCQHFLEAFTCHGPTPALERIYWEMWLTIFLLSSYLAPIPLPKSYTLYSNTFLNSLSFSSLCIKCALYSLPMPADGRGGIEPDNTIEKSRGPLPM